MMGTSEKALSKTDSFLVKAVEASLEKTKTDRRKNKVDRTTVTWEKISTVLSNGHLINSENRVEKLLSICSIANEKSQLFSTFII